MQTEEELREDGFQWDNVLRAFLWSDLSKDFIRQLVQYDQTYKTQLEHHLLAAFHGYSQFPSLFYKNMYSYIKLGLAEQKQLSHYVEQIYMMYTEQKNKEWNASRQVFQFTDGTGRVLDTYVV